jgi:predicted transcriptional regulator
MRGRARKISSVRASISRQLIEEFGFSRAEIARQGGVCASAIARAVQKKEAEKGKC